MKNLIYNVLNDMSEHLNMLQMKRLQEVLIKSIEEKKEDECEQTDSLDYVRLFLSAKNIEGCTDRTINFISRHYSTC